MPVLRSVGLVAQSPTVTPTEDFEVAASSAGAPPAPLNPTPTAPGGDPNPQGPNPQIAVDPGPPPIMATVFKKLMLQPFYGEPEGAGHSLFPAAAALAANAAAMATESAKPENDKKLKSICDL